MHLTSRVHHGASASAGNAANNRGPSKGNAVPQCTQVQASRSRHLNQECPRTFNSAPVARKARSVEACATNAPESLNGTTTVVERPVNPDVVCHLSLPHKCNEGEVIKIVGNHPSLGSWDAAKAPVLTLGEADTWSAEVALPPGVYEFKAVIYNQETDTAKWELIQSRTMEVPTVQGTLRVKCSWGNNNMHLAFQPSGGPTTSANGNGAAASANGSSKPAPAPTPKREASPRAAPAPPEGTVRVQYTDDLKEWVAYEVQVLGLLSNFSALPLDRLHSVLGFTMVERKFNKSSAELEAYMGLLVAQGFVAVNDKGWYTIQSMPAPLTATERPPTPPRKRLEIVKPTPRPAPVKPTPVVNRPPYMPAKAAAPAPAPVAAKVEAVKAPAPAPPAPKPVAAAPAPPAPKPAAPKPVAAAPAPAAPKPVAAAPAPPAPKPVAAAPAPPAPKPVAAAPAAPKPVAAAPAAPKPVAATSAAVNRARSPVPVTARVPTPRPSGAAYPTHLRGWNVFETQTLGLVSNFQSISLERLYSVMKLTMVNPKFDKTQDELGTYLDFLVSEGLVTVDDQGWFIYVQDRPPAPVTTKPPTTASVQAKPASTVAASSPSAASAARSSSPTTVRSASPRAGSPKPRPDPALSLPVSQAPKDVPIWWPAAEIESYRQARAVGTIPPPPVLPPPATPRPPNMSEEQTAAIAENTVVAVGVVALASLLIANVTHQVTVNPKYVGTPSTDSTASIKK